MFHFFLRYPVNVLNSFPHFYESLSPLSPPPGHNSITVLTLMPTRHVVAILIHKYSICLQAFSSPAGTETAFYASKIYVQLLESVNIIFRDILSFVLCSHNAVVLCAIIACNSCAIIL